MRFVAEEGLWTAGPVRAPAPLTAVLEVTGAVLSWTVDEPEAGAHIAFTDVRRADWLWRIVGEQGHDAVVTALGSRPATGSIDVPVSVTDGVALTALRRLAVGHWLRRWWPASRRDGIAVLDAALLDGELALLTARADAFFTDDTLDSDLAELLSPRLVGLDAAGRLGDPRVVELVDACRDLAEDIGVAGVQSDGDPARGRRDDYALAAGSGPAAPDVTTIATGVASVPWAAVPPGVFDAAEDTVDWRVWADGATVSALVRAEVAGSGAHGISVFVESGALSGSGTLSEAGESTIGLVDASGDPVTEHAGWNHDWRDTVVRVGPRVPESRQLRDRARTFARSRSRRLPADVYLAEVLAAESDY
ncbi:MAG: hypothetical protein SW019_03220 [Actinomycetota bacterium]|nr:hypothetical protein [Actinomycetota bacterium]